MAAPTFTPQATAFHPTTANTAQAPTLAGKPIVNVNANSNAFAPPARLGSGGNFAATAAKVSPQQQPLQKSDAVLAKAGSGEKVVEEGQGEEELKIEEAEIVATQNEEEAVAAKSE